MFTLIASYMSVDDLAAQTVLRNIGLITFMIPVGIAISGIILVGNNIGSKNIEAAITYAKYCTLTGFIWAFASVLVINLAQTPIIGVFSSSPTVNDKIQQAFAVISIFVFFDCV